MMETDSMLMVKNLAGGRLRRLLRGCLALLLMLLATQASAQVRDTLRGTAHYAGVHIPYAIIAQLDSLPPHEQVPVILFLHGAGERGTDNKLQLTVALPELAKSLDKLQLRNYVLIAPQCPLDKKWVDTDWTLPSHKMADKINPPLAAVMHLLQTVQVLFSAHIDSSRIYLTGISMGGFGTWDLLQRYPERFAAAMPICGGGDTAQVAQMKSVPIWAFHGKKDKLVKVNRTTDMVAALTRVGGDVRDSLYEDLGHLCWNQSYQNLEAVKWLIAQRRK